jgi:hypothetical protein
MQQSEVAVQNEPAVPQAPGTQIARAQMSPRMQLKPQAPQLSGLDCRFAQTPAQFVVPGGQGPGPPLLLLPMPLLPPLLPPDLPVLPPEVEPVLADPSAQAHCQTPFRQLSAGW